MDSTSVGYRRKHEFLNHDSRDNGKLAPEHRRQLIEGSGIDPEIVAERGYQTLTEPQELRALGFSKNQRRTPALLMPTYGPDGEPAGYQVRPDKPRSDSNKYETPYGSGVRLNVHPGMAEKVRDASVRLWITEGAKKIDAKATHGEAAISLQGVWCWRSKKQGGPLPEWEQIPLVDREVLVAFDSDVTVKDSVQKALSALTLFLHERGARVQIVYLPDAPDGSKQGVDDYLVNGGTVEEMVELAVEAQPSFATTDLGNARRLVALHGAELRYCYPWGAWLSWDGRRWCPDRTGEVERRAKDVPRLIDKEIAREPDDNRRKALRRHANSSESQARIQAMISLARSEPGISVLPEELDADPWLLNVSNGTLDLRSGELREHDPDDLITKLAPVEYDPEATAPTWDRFLQRILPGNELRDFVQKAAGYSATGDVRERVLLILHGLGRNGKSTFLEAIRDALGNEEGYAMKTPAETLMAKPSGGIPNDVARLKGARFVAASETEANRRLAESTVKELTGNDTISARFMRAEWFDFRPTHQVWLATNHRPEIRGTDPAIWDRIRLVPFEVRIPDTEQDQGLPAKLNNELPGILSWIVQGCLDWQREGLGEPEAVRFATSAYQAEQDVLGSFLEEECVKGVGKTAWAKELYAAYHRWCEESGERPETQQAFGRRLTERGFESKKSTGNKSRWYGIGLLDQRELP